MVTQVLTRDPRSGTSVRASILLALTWLRHASCRMKSCVNILTGALRCTRTLWNSQAQTAGSHYASRKHAPTMLVLPRVSHFPLKTATTTETSGTRWVRMRRTRSSRRTATEMGGRRPPSQEDNPIQEEAKKKENGSLKLLWLRRTPGTRRCNFPVFNTTAKNIEIGRISIWLVKENPSVPRSGDMGRLDTLIVGSRLVVVIEWHKFERLK